MRTSTKEGESYSFSRSYHSLTFDHSQDRTKVARSSSAPTSRSRRDVTSFPGLTRALLHPELADPAQAAAQVAEEVRAAHVSSAAKVSVPSFVAVPNVSLTLARAQRVTGLQLVLRRTLAAEELAVEEVEEAVARRVAAFDAASRVITAMPARTATVVREREQEEGEGAGQRIHASR